MVQPLLATKLYAPTNKPGLVTRSSLLQKLEAGFQHGSRLTLISAPAGYGKSTLAIEWISRHPSATWLSLDDGDNDPARFLQYFIAALQKVDPSIGRSAQSLLEQPNDPPIDAVLTILINDLTAHDGPVALVLDDYHLIQNMGIHQWLDALVQKQPPNLHLIVITRTDPALSLSRLRGRGQLTEVRSKDLRFTTPEAQAFFHQTMGLALADEDVAIIEKQTEGWVAGMQLAGLSLGGIANPRDWLRSFNGEERYIMDYLIEEVLERQPEEVQQFLLKTSILERMCAALCDALYENRDSRFESRPEGTENRVTSDVARDRGRISTLESRISILDYLDRSNLFLIPLDNHRQWYRYHHLFADLLSHFLKSRAPEQVPELHKRASRWYEANGFVRDAVKHAFRSEDWDFAADVVERHGYNTLIRSQVATLHDWCATFPDPVLENRPALCIFNAWTLALSWRANYRDAGEQRIRQAEGALAAWDPSTVTGLVPNSSPVRLHDWVAGQAAVVRSIMHMSASKEDADPHGLIALSQKALDLLPETDLPGRSASLLNIGYAQMALSDAAAAERVFEEAVDMGMRGGNFYGAVIGIFYHVRTVFYQGQLTRAVLIAQQGKKSFEARFAHPELDLPAIGTLNMALGCISLERNDLVEAENYLKQGLALAQWMPREELVGFLGLARLREIQGDTPGFLDTLNQLEKRWPAVGYCTEALRVLHQVKTSPNRHTERLDAAVRRMRAPNLGPDMPIPGIGPSWGDETDYAAYFAWAQVQILLGQPRAALAFIDPVLAAAEKCGLGHRLIELSLAQALAWQAQGDRARAFEALARALAAAEPEGYVQAFNLSPALVQLMVEAAAQGNARRSIQNLLTALRKTSSEADEGEIQGGIPPVHQNSALIEPLSDREMEVLRLFAEGLTTAEIAGRLYLSPNTLKAHTQNIYSKLDVHSRVQALNKARELGIL